MSNSPRSKTTARITVAIVLFAGTAFGNTVSSKAAHEGSVTPAKSTRTARATSASTRSTKPSRTAKGRRSRAKARRPRGQQAIDGSRATEIQQALIREKYLDGEATGVWDQRTKDAMARYQADNGWQTKVLPDSRALIKLGLGPDHSNLINPESAASPHPATTTAGKQ